MDRFKQTGKEWKAKPRKEKKLLKAPMNVTAAEISIVAGEGDRPQETFPTNEMAIASGRIDETAKDSGSENVINGEAMEVQGPTCGSAQHVKPLGVREAPGADTVVELQPSELDARQRRRVEGSNPISVKDHSTETSDRFHSDVNRDSRIAGGRNGDAGGYRRQPSTSRVDDFKRIDSLGRLLSSVLRHRAVKLGLKMRSDGYVLVKDLLNLRLKTQAGKPLSSYVVGDIQEAVRRDNKQRFGLREENGELLIRANQGHSIQTVKSEDLLRPILCPEEVPVCVHGTYLNKLGSINKEGLKRMQRLHVHFATGLPKEKGVISGMRNSCDVLIHLNVRKYLEDGMKLYCSENGVILAEGNNGVIAPDYFAKVEKVKR